MRKLSIFIFTLTTISILMMGLSFAKVAPGYDQTVISVTKIEHKKTLVDQNDNNYQLATPQLAVKAREFINESARILFIVMADRKIITDITSDAAPPFTIPTQRTQTAKSVQQ